MINGRIGGKVVSLTEAYLDYQGVSKRVGDARDYAAAHNLMDFSRWVGYQTRHGYARRQFLAPIQEYYQVVGGNFMGSQYVWRCYQLPVGRTVFGLILCNLFGGVIRNLSLSVIGRNLFLYLQRCSG